MAAILVASCQSNDPQPAAVATAEPQVTVDELRAFCPRVTIAPQAAVHNVYERGADGDRTRLVRQVSLADQTRNCSYGAGTMTVNVAAAGRIVTGPRGGAGAVTVPVRIEARRGAEVIYSQVQNVQVQVADAIGATQFLVSDPNVTLPQEGVQQVRIFVGLEQ